MNFFSVSSFSLPQVCHVRWISAVWSSLNLSFDILNSAKDDCFRLNLGCFVRRTSHEEVNGTINALATLWNQLPCNSFSACLIWSIHACFTHFSSAGRKLSQSLWNWFFTFGVRVLFLIFFYAHQNSSFTPIKSHAFDSSLEKFCAREVKTETKSNRKSLRFTFAGALCACLRMFNWRVGDEPCYDLPLDVCKQLDGW